MRRSKTVENIRRLFERYVVEKLSVVSKDGKTIVLPNLKVQHDSGLRYTVSNVSGDVVTLKTPEGKKFEISRKEFEKEYSVDL